MASDLVLRNACREGEVDEVRRRLDRGADVNQAYELGRTPLHMACLKGHVAVARLLIDRGADLERADTNGETPLYVACEKDRVAAAQLCLDRGADIRRDTRGGLTPLWIACCRGHADAVRLCLIHGADLYRVTPGGGYSPLSIAVTRRIHHPALAAWLDLVHAAGGFTRFLSEPRFALVNLRALAEAGRARRATSENEQLLDFLFPSGDSPLAPRTRKQATRARLPHLPSDLFPLVIRMYWSADAP